MKLKVQLQKPRNRNRYKPVPHSDYVASVIAKHYHILKQEVSKGDQGNFNSMTYEDIFQETILYVIQDKKAFDLTEVDIITLFKYRYNMIQFQIIQDSRLITTTDANNIQTKEESE